MSATSILASYAHTKARARKIVHERIRILNRSYQFTYRRIAIRDQVSRWGSCSADKNLNFNYRILFLPQHLVDYVIVHELCHLAELNHSARFWVLVEATLPDYRKHRLELRRYKIL